MSLGVENMSFYVFVRAPTGPDPRRAPPGPRGGPGGEPRGGPRAQGKAQGRAHQGPGPGARAKHFWWGNVSRRLKWDFFIIINVSIICIYNMCL